MLPVITTSPLLMPNTSTFAQDLKRRRLARGWTQQQLAIKAGVERSAIALYESGRGEPRLEKFFKICKAFGVTEILNTN